MIWRTEKFSADAGISRWMTLSGSAFQMWQQPGMLGCRWLTVWKRTRQFADKPTRDQSTLRLNNSRTGRLHVVQAVYCV